MPAARPTPDPAPDPASGTDTAADRDLGTDTVTGLALDSAPDPAADPAAEHRSSVRSLLRLWPYVRTVRGKAGAVGGGRGGRLLHGAAHPAGAQVDGGRAGAAPRPGGRLARRRAGAAARPAGGRAVRHPALAGRPAAGARRGGDARRPLRAPPAAAGGLPRPLGVGPAAVPGHHGPADPAAVPRLPAGLPGGQLRRRSWSASSILFVQSWLLGPGAAGSRRPADRPLLATSRRRYSLAARRAQDQVGDLATVVEESVLGIRIIKAFGRHRSQAARLPRADRAACARTELRKARLLADIWAVIIDAARAGDRRRAGARRGPGRRRQAVGRAPWSPSCPPRSPCAGRWSRSASCSR